MQLPDLSRYDRVGFDTETTGLTRHHRPVGCSVATPDGQSVYLAWGHGDPAGIAGPPGHGNNISLGDFKRWAARELTHPHVTYVGHNVSYDSRMLAYHGVFLGPRVEDTQVCASLLDENRISFALEDLARGLGLGGKSDAALHAWCAAKFGGKATRKAQAPHYWDTPVAVMREYAEHDPVLTLGVYDRLRPEIDKEGLGQVYRLETDLLPVLLRTHLVGTRVDRRRAEGLKAQMTEELERLQAEWRRFAGGVNYRSAVDLRPVLDRLGIRYPLTAKTKVPSITKAWLEQLDHPLGRHIRRMRQLEHFRDVFIESYVLGNCTDDDPFVHPEFHGLRGDSYGTITGRLSSGGDMNAQNIPARDDEWAPQLRSVYIPANPWQDWGRLDYSQIEYRLFAHFAGELARAKGEESTMERAYLNDAEIDFHSWVAETVGIPRKQAKNVNFCKLYGGGIKKIAQTAGVSVEQASEFVQLYEARIPEAKRLSDELMRLAERRGFVRTLSGRRGRFMTEGQAAARYNKQVEGNANRYSRTYRSLNKVLQGSAGDLIKRAMVRVDREIDWETTLMHLTVHDELDFSVPKGLPGSRILEGIAEIMRDAAKEPGWNGQVMRVPVRADVEQGSNWGML